MLALLLATVPPSSQAADTGASIAQTLDVVVERSRIQADEVRDETHFAEEEAACFARFAVTDCLREVRVRRREALDALRRQEVMLNDVERKRKAAEQIERINEKLAVQRAQEDTAAGLQGLDAQQERRVRANGKVADSMNAKSGQVAGKTAENTVESGRAGADVARAQKQYRDKLKEADEHRASSEARNSGKSGAPSKPLTIAP